MAQTQTPADKVVAQLRTLPAPLPRPMGSEGRVIESEVTRRKLYEELRQLGDAALPALARGLRDSDVRLRRNVALALGALGGTWWDRAKTRLDITPLLSDLVRALKDEDPLVRNWSAQAIGNIGAGAGPAVPALVALLEKEEESRISVCGALRQIGPPARAAYRAC
jgi:HEAT repeat protein